MLVDMQEQRQAEMQGLQHPPRWGCTRKYTHTDSATTSDKDLQGHCIPWGRAQKLRGHINRETGCPWDAQLHPRGAGACSIRGFLIKGCRWCQELDPDILGYMLHRKSQLRETLSFLARKPGMMAVGWVTFQQLTRLPSLPI